MSKENNLTDFLTDVASAIKEKRGTGNPINAQDFASEVRAIEPLLDTIEITSNGEHNVKDYKKALVVVPLEDLENMKNLIERKDKTEVTIPYGVTKLGYSILNFDDGSLSSCRYNAIHIPTTVVEFGIKCLSISGTNIYYQGSLDAWFSITRGSVQSYSNTFKYDSYATYLNSTYYLYIDNELKNSGLLNKF